MAHDRKPRPPASSTPTVAAAKASTPTESSTTKPESRSKKREEKPEPEPTDYWLDPIPKKAKKAEPKEANQDEGENEYGDSHSENSSVKVLGSQKATKTAAKPELNLNGEGKSSASLSDDTKVDEDDLQDNYTIVECRALALAKFYERIGVKRLTYTTNNKLASAAVALANAIDDNIWFPPGYRSPGSDLFAFIVQMHIRNPNPNRLKEQVVMQTNNWINHLLKPLYCLQKCEDDTFSLLAYGTYTPIAVVFPNPGESKFSGFAVCGSWIYNAKEDYTLPVTQKNLLKLKYLQIVNSDGTVERRQEKEDKEEVMVERLEKAVSRLEASSQNEEMMKRLEHAIEGIESYSDKMIKKLAQGTSPPTKDLTEPTDQTTPSPPSTETTTEKEEKTTTPPNISEEAHPPTPDVLSKTTEENPPATDAKTAATEPKPEANAESKATESAETKPADLKPEAMPETTEEKAKAETSQQEKAEDEKMESNPSSEKATSLASAKQETVTPPEPKTVKVVMDPGEVYLKPGQSLEVAPGIKLFVVVPHKEYLTKLYYREAEKEKRNNQSHGPHGSHGPPPYSRR